MGWLKGLNTRSLMKSLEDYANAGLYVQDYSPGHLTVQLRGEPGQMVILLRRLTDVIEEQYPIGDDGA